MGRILGLACAVLCFMTVPGTADERRPVDALIVSAIDVSGSIDGHALRLELEGIAGALVHPTLLHMIGTGPHGRMGFAAFTWSSQNDFHLVMPWTGIGTSDEAEAAASRLVGVWRQARFGSPPSRKGVPPWRGGSAPTSPPPSPSPGT